jgi:hypothetical protein
MSRQAPVPDACRRAACRKLSAVAAGSRGFAITRARGPAADPVVSASDDNPRRGTRLSRRAAAGTQATLGGMETRTRVGPDGGKVGCWLRAEDSPYLRLSRPAVGCLRRAGEPRAAVHSPAAAPSRIELALGITAHVGRIVVSVVKATGGTDLVGCRIAVPLQGLVEAFEPAFQAREHLDSMADGRFSGTRFGRSAL